jgi:predicted CoA-binding protein
VRANPSPEAAWYGTAVARRILTTYRTFAVVGCSSNPARPSNRVARFLASKGYRVVCVNPNEAECFGEACYPDLQSASASEQVEVVDIFRRADKAGVHVDEAIAIGAKAVWMQLGVIDEAAAARARDAGLDVVMDRCPAIDYPRLVGDRLT